jgi:hypothetical protein
MPTTMVSSIVCENWNVTKWWMIFFIIWKFDQAKKVDPIILMVIESTILILYSPFLFFNLFGDD